MLYKIPWQPGLRPAPHCRNGLSPRSCSAPSEHMVCSEIRFKDVLRSCSWNLHVYIYSTLHEMVCSTCIVNNQTKHMRTCIGSWRGNSFVKFPKRKIPKSQIEYEKRAAITLPYSCILMQNTSQTKVTATTQLNQGIYQHQELSSSFLYNHSGSLYQAVPGDHIMDSPSCVS